MAIFPGWALWKWKRGQIKSNYFHLYSSKKVNCPFYTGKVSINLFDDSAGQCSGVLMAQVLGSAGSSLKSQSAVLRLHLLPNAKRRTIKGPTHA